MNKKLIIGIVVVLAVLAAIGGVLARRGTSAPEEIAVTEVKKKTRVAQPVNVIPVSERPYVRVEPNADGRNVTLAFIELKKPADSAEYTLEYQAGTLLQGVFGTFDLSELPFSDTKLLGSCSAGGSCTYHEDVQGGTLLIELVGSEPYALKSDWRYIENTSRDTAASSRDAKFQIEADGLARVGYVVIYNSPGYPGTLEGEPVSGVYAVAPSGTVAGPVTLSIRADQSGELRLFGWDSAEWSELEASVNDKTIQSEHETLYDAYVVVQ